MGRAKSSVKRGLCLCQTVLVQVRTDVAALGRVGGVELIGVQLTAGDDYGVMGIAGRVTGVQPVVKSGDQVVHAADRPVVSKVQVFERARLDGCPLLARDAAAQCLAAIDHVVRCGVVLNTKGSAAAGHNQRAFQLAAGQGQIGFLRFLLQILFGFVDLGVDLRNLLVHHRHGCNGVRVNGHGNVGNVRDCHNAVKLNLKIAVFRVGRDFHAAVVLHNNQQGFVAVCQLCIDADLMQNVPGFHVLIGDLDFDALASVVAGAVGRVLDAKNFKGLLLVFYAGQRGQRFGGRSACAAHGFGDRHGRAGKHFGHHVRANVGIEGIVPAHVLPPILISICCRKAATPTGAGAVAVWSAGRMSPLMYAAICIR